MSHNKFWLVVSVLIVIGMIFTACAPKAGPLPTNQPATVAPVTVAPATVAPATVAPATQAPAVAAPTQVQFCATFSSSITENGWDNSAYQSFLRFAANPGMNINVLPLKYVVGLFGDQATAALRAYAEGGCDIIWDTAGDNQTLFDIYKNYPKVMFVQIGSGWVAGGGDNLYQYMHRCYDGSYLMGVLAGLMTKGTAIGGVGGFPAEDTVDEINSFFAGAKSVKPELKQKVTFINSWYDPIAAGEAAQSQKAAGADMVYMGSESFDSCGAGKGLMCFGSYMDWSQLYPGAMMASFVATWEPAYKWAVQAWIKAKATGEWSGGPLSFTNKMATGACTVTLGKGIQDTLPADVLAKYNATYEGIMNGTIVPTLDTSVTVSDK